MTNVRDGLHLERNHPTKEAARIDAAALVRDSNGVLTGWKVTSFVDMEEEGFTFTVSKTVEDNDGRVEGVFHCGRCARTGDFITYVENGKPKGPGGVCFRCQGKGHHTQADRRRNYGSDLHTFAR